MELRVGNVLDGRGAIDGEGGGGAGGLAEDHVDGFHAERGVGDVGRGEANRHEEVGALRFLRDEGVVADAVGADGAGDEMGAFFADAAVGVDEGRDDVGIEGVGADADGMAGVDAGLAAEVFLFQDEGAAQAAGFADVELMREISVVGELVLGPAPGGEFFADGGGDAGVVGEGPEHAEGVVAVLGGDSGAFGVGGGGVVEIGADEIEVVGVGLPIGHRGERDDFLERGVGLELEAADEGFVPERIEVGGFGEGEAVGGVVGEGDAVAVGLAAVVLVAGFAPEGAVDERQEAGGGIAGADPRIDGALGGADEAGGADAVHGFAVGGVGFAADDVADAGAGHEVALVGGVDEDAAGVAVAGGGAQR